MESNGKFIFTMFIIIGIIIALAGYYFIGMNDNVSFNDVIPINKIVNRKPNNNTTNNTANTTNNTVDNQVEFSSVKDYQVYFSINSLINKYYSEMTNNNYKQVMGMLDDYYLLNNKITGSNITSFIKTGYQNITYYSKIMYVKSNNKIAYYFVEGEEQLYNFIEEKLTEEENVSYIVTIDKDNDTFSVTPLSTPSIFEYAQNYVMTDKKAVKSNAYNSYFSDSISDETLCSYYIVYFKTLLYLNTEKAYNMLESSYKSSFADYEDFVKNLQVIYEKLDPKLMNYSANGENGRRTYSVITEKNIRINMTESSILNFKVSIN